MKKDNYIVRTLKNRIRRNEEIVKTRKAKKAMGVVFGVVAFMLGVEWLINVAEAYKPKPLFIEGKPLSWDARETAEVVTDTLVTGTQEDGIVAIGGIEEQIAKMFPEDPKTAIAIAKAESNLRTDAVGDGHIMFLKDGKPMGMSCGLFQIRVLEGRPDCESLKDVETSLKFARALYEKSGWKPWSVFNNNSYLKYLD